jgi:hypothetical protein
LPRVPIAAFLALSLAVPLIGALGACSPSAKPAAKPAAAPAAAPAAKPAAPPPRLTGDQMVKLEADFGAARKIIGEARTLRAEGERLEREKGREAASPTLYKARKKYREAAGMTETWIEGDLGVVSKAQVDAYLQSWFQERAAWIKEDASMGQKLHE